MAILSWKTSDGQTGQWQINQAETRIGRAEGNDFTVPDGSVSSVHAELVLDGGTLIIRDLGSTNGTFIYDQRVQQAIVEPGQSFRLGNVQFSFEQETELIQEALPPPSAPVHMHLAPTAPAAPASSSMDSQNGPGTVAGPICFYHPVSAAAYSCTKCCHDLCAACAKQELIGGKRFPFCRHCGGKCVGVGQSAIPQQKRRAKFGELLPTTFTYPLKGNGLILLITGSFFFGFLDFITSARVPRPLFILVLTLVVKAIMFGYLFAFMQKIVSASADGDDHPPSWPEVTDIGQDVFHPFWLFFATAVACFGPGFFLYAYQPLPGIALMLIGAFYFPMALLAVAMSDSLGGLNPLIVFSAILKVPGPYTVSVIACGFLVLVRTWVPAVIAEMNVPFVSWFAVSGAALFLVMVEMRILGILYYTNKEKFGWY